MTVEESTTNDDDAAADDDDIGQEEGKILKTKITLMETIVTLFNAFSRDEWKTFLDSLLTSSPYFLCNIVCIEVNAIVIARSLMNISFMGSSRGEEFLFHLSVIMLLQIFRTEFPPNREELEALPTKSIANDFSKLLSILNDHFSLQFLDSLEIKIALFVNLMPRIMKDVSSSASTEIDDIWNLLCQLKSKLSAGYNMDEHQEIQISDFDVQKIHCRESLVHILTSYNSIYDNEREDIEPKLF